MTLFRIHIRPSGGNPDMDATFQYCLDNRLLGVGWRVRVDGLQNTQNWGVYREAAAQEHDNIQQPQFIQKNVQPRDLVWTRAPCGQYYLAKVTGGWEYWMNEEGRNKDFDIANIFRCKFHQVKLDAVPGRVVRSFTRGRTIQSIPHDATLAYSQHLWNELSGQQVYTDAAQAPGFWEMLDPEETEDLVFLYLQSKGWWVVPNSRMGNTLRFEYMLVHPVSGMKALVQVKSGDVGLNVSDYGDEAQHIFLFQSNEYYDGDCVNHVTCIARDEVIDFLRQHENSMPAWLQKKFRLCLGALTGLTETISRGMPASL